MSGDEVVLVQGKGGNRAVREDASMNEIRWAIRCSSRKSSEFQPEGILGYGASN
jgi:hypothetical protein